MPRFYCPTPLATGQRLALPPGAARHAQVLRLQPGHTVTLFNGEGGEWDARIERMGRSDVEVCVEEHHAIERESPRAVHLAMGVPANERMDWLVEKATELGVASIQPLMTAHAVLRLSGERADRKRAHWRAVAAAACEQCGRNRLPEIHEPVDFERWLAAAPGDTARAVLSLSPQAQPALQVLGGTDTPVLLLSGPEGGLAAREEESALERGFSAVTLGPRTLRAETAPLALVAALVLQP